ncbi:hypothetical protein cyc_06887 [Cyclospora cayetanensis]|uniref:Uncharacterized protein n=1 Tax=Cyclospora cayetanensis TaxID=88456 RepID=A0A1D3D377_9EIME|nr:hypothetical protein cyc_06887 [Cyclospora cayetanensis]
MSVSSLGAAAVLPGGSSRSDSVSEGGSADSLFIRDIHDRRERKRLELEKELTDSDEDSGGFFHDLLRQFRHCCAGRKKSRLAYGEGAYSGVATAAADGFAAAVAKGPPRARTYSGSVTGSHSGSSSSTATRSDLADKYIGDKAYMVTWRIVLGQPAGSLRAPMRGEGALSAEPPTLTPNQAGWAACAWCVRLENNERMSGRMIGELFLAAESQRASVDVAHAVKESSQFQTLHFSRRIDGPNIEDVMGDFNGMYLEEIEQPASLAKGGGGGKEPSRGAAGVAIYAVLQAIRIVGMYVRRHGELTEYAAFNVTPNEKELFPPSFLGFKTLEDMQEYVLELFKRDFRVKRASGVSALLFKSRTLHTAAPERADYTAERESRADVLAKLQDLREKDPKYDAKMLYTNMFKATADEENPDEVFALEQGVGMQIQDRGAFRQKQKYMSPDELACVHSSLSALALCLCLCRRLTKASKFPKRQLAALSLGLPPSVSLSRQPDGNGRLAELQKRESGSFGRQRVGECGEQGLWEPPHVPARVRGLIAVHSR